MFWEELTGDEFEKAVPAVGRVCLLPLSVLERHGHHMPLSTDMLIGRELCRRAAALEPAIVFPNMIFNQILEARHCPGTIAVDPDVMLALLDNACREIARNGLNKIVIVNAHGGNNSLMRYFSQTQLANRRDYMLYIAEPRLLPEDAEVEKQWASTVDGHAGEEETSMILAIRPDLVRADQLRDDGEGLPQGRLSGLRQAGVETAIWWYADHPTHYRGDGIPATAEKGERLLAARGRALAAAIRLIKADTEGPRLQAEFFAASARH